MIGIKCLRLTLVKARVAQPHRLASRGTVSPKCLCTPGLYGGGQRTQSSERKVVHTDANSPGLVSGRTNRSGIFLAGDLSRTRSIVGSSNDLDLGHSCHHRSSSVASVSTGSLSKLYRAAVVLVRGRGGRLKNGSLIKKPF